MRYFLFFLMVAMPVWAQNSKPVWSTDYSASNNPQPQRTASNTADARSLPPRPVANNRAPFVQPKNLGSVDAAWVRQWTPIQNISGFSQGQAQDFIQGVKRNYARGSAETLANARDWALILGSTGLVGEVSATGTDWFQYVSQDIPGAIMSLDPRFMGSTSLMGGSFGGMGYPGLSIPAE
jgi:hypothetical protein